MGWCCRPHLQDSGIQGVIGGGPGTALGPDLVKHFRRRKCGRRVDLDGKEGSDQRPNTVGATAAGLRVDVQEALRWLTRTGTKKGVEDLKRYGITAAHPFGVPVGVVKKYAGSIGTDHDLAVALWDSGRYEARLLAAFVDDPARVSLSQMNLWASEFDNWAVVDTVCFHLFDRTAHAWTRVDQWARTKPEFKKRAAFALLWSLSVHDRTATDASFRDDCRSSKREPATGAST